jgi:hypothetical protein
LDLNRETLFLRLAWSGHARSVLILGSQRVAAPRNNIHGPKLRHHRACEG